jgi:hypothetical protein
MGIGETARKPRQYQLVRAKCPVNQWLGVQEGIGGVPVNIAHALHVFQITVELLRKDVALCQQELEAAKVEDIQYRLRAFIRVLMAFIEGTIHQMRLVALSTGSKAKLSTGEEFLLRGMTANLRDNGEVQVREGFYPSGIDRNIKLAFRVFVQAIESKHKPDYGGKGWQCLQQLIEIRNRISHPMTAEEFLISGDEATAIKEAYVWFMDTCAKLTRQYESSG